MDHSKFNFKLGLHKFDLGVYRLLRKNKISNGIVKKLNCIFSKNMFHNLVVSYPKCGRTWLRFMVNQGEALAYDVPLNNTINETRYRKFRIPRAKYIHGNYKNFSNKLNNLDMQISNKNINGMIFLVRNPERVMISYYNHAVYRDKTFKDADISEFIRDKDFGIANYINYIEYYYNCIKENNHLILRYEDLKKNTFSEMKKIFKFLEIELRDDQVRMIVDNSSFTNMKQYELNNKYDIDWLVNKSKDPRAAKIRMQGKESLNDYFSNDDLDFMKSHYFSLKIFNKFGYCRSSHK